MEIQNKAAHANNSGGHLSYTARPPEPEPESLRQWFWESQVPADFHASALPFM